MLNLNYYLRHLFMMMTIAMGCCATAQTPMALPPKFTFTTFQGNTKLPYNIISDLHQDKAGFMWIGTENGLYRYDGFYMKRYASSQLHPGFFTTNEITCVEEDEQNNLWIGTRAGLMSMNLQTGIIRKYHLTDFDNTDAISKIYITKQGALWIGTQGGLYRYDKKQDAFVLYCDKRGNAKIPHCSVTSIIEDRKGYLWVGTWDKGLYRYYEVSGQWYEMPRFNDINSAHSLYMTKKGQLYVATWGKGLYRIDNPYDTAKPLHMQAYTKANTAGGLLSDQVWSILYQPQRDILWLGTSNGVSMLCQGKVSALPSIMMEEPTFFSHGATFKLIDNSGQVWALGAQRGLAMTRSSLKRFDIHEIPQPFFNTDYLTAMAYDNDERLWMGLHNSGILHQDANGQWLHLETGSIVYGITHLDDGSSLVATERGGVLIVKNGSISNSYDSKNTSWLKDNCVYTIFVSPDGNLLFGTWKGLSILYPNGKGTYLETPHLKELTQMRVRNITRSKDGVYWLATSNGGIIRMTGNLWKPASLRIQIYNKLRDANYSIKNIYRMLADRKGNIWACCQEAGLLRYDAENDCFESKDMDISIPDESVYSIEESLDGRLWASSRNNLISFTCDEQGKISDLKVFSKTEAIGGDLFGHRLSVISQNGKICFGGITHFTVFDNKIIQPSKHKAHCYISDLMIYDTYLSDMDSTVRIGITPQQFPYAKEITLSHNQRDFTLEIATMNASGKADTRFAYMLKGYDKDWHYADIDDHHVSYNNLPSGNYTFLFKGSNDDGSWSTEVEQLDIHILAPWYLRWYALMSYLLILSGFGYFIIRFFRNREESRREIQIAHMESKNIEELNHKKLQFFTNITHDLMTPLTVISATVGNLREEHPTDAGAYRIIDSNVNRLMRLLQQILEFRKSETGNLHLRVTRGNLTEFLEKEIESIQPLANMKHLNLTFSCQQQIEGYFDTDAVDKILYNLISNATKYNHEGGNIEVELHGDEWQHAIFTVKDDGIGIAKEKIAVLFHRFYEGEHRKFKTYGTGIGLSLVKDLTELHHGTVSVESQLDKGSIFTVTIPIYKEAFKPEEIDDTTSLILTEEEPADDGAVKPDKAKTLLLVEDNEDLLMMLHKLLEHHYRILSAYNGQQALEMAAENKIDLIITDIMMPIMDGVEMTRRLRTDKQYKNCPVIMLTAKRDDEHRTEAYKVGADAYITKPFNTSVLLARVENLLEHRQKTNQEITQKLLDGIKDTNLCDTDQDFINRCIQVVHRHIADTSLDLPIFAEEMGMSKSSLYKKLKSITGKSTSAFIRSIRMKAACELIRKNPQALVAEVAYAVGYNDPKYFSACFKKDFGCLPSEYGIKIEI